jgi:hypothetical protein
VSLVTSCSSLSAEHRSQPMADVQRTFSYKRRTIHRGQIYSAFEVHNLYFNFFICSPLYTKFLGQSTFFFCLKYRRCFESEIHVPVHFQYSKFNIQIYILFSSLRQRILLFKAKGPETTFQLYIVRKPTLSTSVILCCQLYTSLPYKLNNG